MARGVSAPLTGTALAIFLAMLGAGCFAGAAVLQHRAVDAVTTATTGDALSLRGMRVLLGRPGWLTGFALAGVGSGLHATALVLAPLSVVQPVGVLAVPLAVLLTVARTRTRPPPAVLTGVGLSVAGVAAFVGLTAGTAVSTPVSDGATLLAGATVAGIVAVLAGLGLPRSGWVRCVACATAGAVAFGLVSALLRTVAQQVVSGAAGLGSPAVLATAAAIIAALLGGGWFVQQGYASGPPEVVIACLTVVDPIVAVLLGVVLLGEGSATPVGTWLLLLVAAATATAGVVALARHHPDAAARSTPAAPGSDAPSRHALNSR